MAFDFSTLAGDPEILSVIKAVQAATGVVQEKVEDALRTADALRKEEAAAIASASDPDAAKEALEEKANSGDLTGVVENFKEGWEVDNIITKDQRKK